MTEVDRKSSVSMNYWGFHPSIFEEIEKGLHNFMRKNTDNPTAEYYIPNIITDMIVNGQMNVRVIPTNDNWFGVTYKEDKQMAIDSINKCIEKDIYPKNLWRLMAIISEFFPEGKSDTNRRKQQRSDKSDLCYLDRRRKIKKYILQSVNTNVFTNYNLTLDNIIKIKNQFQKKQIFPIIFQHQ